MARYELRGVPDQLVPGKYATKVTKESGVVDGELVVVLEFAGRWNDNDPSLFSITKSNADTMLWGGTFEEEVK